ncbi:unnamed protein product [Larinioides sclopetarius]|uniref:C2H2-type domain-containing protein n=1 Tax=Larinioides sclopetarius TaxID=280406 RepID=A0AAV2B3K0_9ARAC
MIAFRCSRCCKVNISTEGLSCFNCNNEEARVYSIPESQTEISNTSTNDNDIFLQMQNKSAGSDFNALSKTRENLNAAKLHESDGKDKDTKTLNVNLSHISSPLVETVPIMQNSILKEMLISPSPATFSKKFRSVDDGQYYSSTKSGTSMPEKKKRHISEQSSCRRSKNVLKEKKTFKRSKNTKSIQNEYAITKIHPENSRPFPPAKSALDSFSKDGISAIQIEDNQPKTDSEKLKTSKRNNPTNNNSFQDDLKTTNTFSQHRKCFTQEVSRKGCIENDLSEKLSINRIKTTILKKLFLCNKCGKTYTDESKLKVHFLNHFKEKLFKCDKCDKEYFSEAHLKRHYKSHMDKDPYKCDLCDLVFTRNCHLSRHRKKHLLEPAVEESTTEQKVDQSPQQSEHITSDDDDLQKHVQTMAEDKIFLCTECGIKFIRESDFNAHCLRHSVQKPFKCNKCNKEFRYEFYLNRHYRVHSLERPFTCKICGFRSTQRSNLNKHLKMHA